MAYVFQNRFEYVTIIPLEDSDGIANGHVKYLIKQKTICDLIYDSSNIFLEKDLIDHIVEKNILITLAGYVAQCEYGDYEHYGATSDFENASDLISHQLHTIEEQSEFWDKCIEKCKTIIK